MKRLFFLASLLLAMLFVIGFQPASTKGSLVEKSSATCEDCSDAWGECKAKVRFNGRNGECVSFSCEVGTPKEHIIKTTDKTGIKALLKIAEKKEEVE